MGTDVGTGRVVKNYFLVNSGDYNNYTSSGGLPWIRSANNTGGGADNSTAALMQLAVSTPNNAERNSKQANSGPTISGEVYAWRARVVNIDLSGGGAITAHFNCNISAGITATPVTATGVGEYGGIVQIGTNNPTGFTLRVGIGAFTNDSGTNSIEIDNIQITKLESGDIYPDEYVPNDFFRSGFPNNTGAVINGDKLLTMDGAGLITDTVPIVSSTPIFKNIYLAGDSFYDTSGLLAKTWFFEKDDYNIQSDVLAGRPAQGNSGVLDGLLAQDYYSLGEPCHIVSINLCVNDILSSGSSADDTIGYLQPYYDFCESNGMWCVINDCSPFSGATGDSAPKQTERLDFNSQLAANPYGANLIVVKLSNAWNAATPGLADDVDPTIIYAPYNTGDSLHPNSTAGRAALQSIVSTAIDAITSQPSTGIALTGPLTSSLTSSLTSNLTG